MEIVFIVILDELFGGSGFLARDRRGDGDVGGGGGGVEIGGAIVLEVDGTEPDGAVVTVHCCSDLRRDLRRRE